MIEQYVEVTLHVGKRIKITHQHKHSNIIGIMKKKNKYFAFLHFQLFMNYTSQNKPKRNSIVFCICFYKK